MRGRSSTSKASSWLTPAKARICSKSGRSLHPYVRWEVAFRIEREQEIGPQLRALGIGPRDVRRSEILVAPGELRTASGWLGRMRGYVSNRWPSWFDPRPLDLAAEPYGPFAASRRLTEAGDVVAVATPGHTADHLSVLVQDGGTTQFLAGDTSYDERLMLAGTVDGVSADDRVAGATLEAIRRLAQAGPTVYLPTHDPKAAARLAERRLVATSG